MSDSAPAISTDPHGPRTAIDPTRFREVLGRYPTGIVVVTAMHEQQAVGMAVNSFTSVSLTPPLVGFFAAEGSTTWPKIQRAGMFCVNVLREDKPGISRQFAAKGAQKFAGISWRHAGSGAPVLDDAAAWIDCRLERVEQTGDHYLVLGQVVDLGARHSPGPLIAYRGDYGGYRPRHESCRSHKRKGSHDHDAH